MPHAYDHVSNNIELFQCCLICKFAKCFFPLQVVSKGLVVVAGKNRTMFSLTPQNSWAPTAELLVYLISFGKDNNKIMQISKTLNIKGTLNQKVTRTQNIFFKNLKIIKHYLNVKYYLKS